MPFDSLITNPGRLRILTALAAQPKQEFVRLRGSTQMTDGNLATHARRLHLAGLLAIDKSFRDGKPVTTFMLTDQGRNALQSHVDRLIQAINPANQAIVETYNPSADESDWID